jgi:hypothetical protein
MPNYESVLWTPQTPLCSETLKTMNDNMDYLKDTSDNGPRGIVGIEELTQTKSKSGSSMGTVGVLRGARTEGGRRYKFSCWMPKIYCPGDKGQGITVHFQLRWGVEGSGETDGLHHVYVFPGQIYRWTSAEIYTYLVPGEGTFVYSPKFAPLFGVGTATLEFDADDGPGYITLEDVGPA